MLKSEVDNNLNNCHSEEIQEIISNPPGWLLNSGIIIFLGILISSLIMASVVSYPDKINAKLEVCSLHSKREITPKTFGTLVKLLVNDGDSVKSGEILAYLSNQYDNEVILNLLSDLKMFKKDLYSDIRIINFPIIRYSLVKAKGFQPAFFGFLNVYQKYKEKCSLHNKSKQSNNLRQHLLIKTNQLIDEIERWKGNYTIVATDDGLINFNGIIQENQSIRPGDKLFFIFPLNNELYGRVKLPEAYIGKVQDGQQVIVKFKRYVNTNYERLKGKISFISSIPENNDYYVSKVNFDPIVKKHSSSKVLKEGMKADAEIIIQQGTVLDRIFNNMKIR